MILDGEYGRALLGVLAILGLTLTICAIARHPEGTDRPMRWIENATIAFIGAILALLSLNDFSLTPASALVLAGSYTGLACGYFAWAETLETRPRIVAVVGLGALALGLPVGLALGTETRLPMVLTTGIAIAAMGAAMSGAVWRAARLRHPEVAPLAALPFAGFAALAAAMLAGLWHAPVSAYLPAAKLLVLTAMLGAIAWLAGLLLFRLRAGAAALAEAQAELRGLRAARAGLLSGLSHDLHRPLNAVMGFAEIMRRESMGPLAGRYRDAAGHIHEAGRELGDLVNDVLEIATMEEAKRAPLTARVSLGEVAAAALERVSATGRKRRVGLLMLTPTLADTSNEAMRQL
ncbi:MAG: histidine kinase dimerization/phospho-acceptor domain-containing protein, partial [Pseudomonadota bacterium]